MEPCSISAPTTEQPILEICPRGPPGKVHDAPDWGMGTEVPDPVLAVGSEFEILNENLEAVLLDLNATCLASDLAVGSHEARLFRVPLTQSIAPDVVAQLSREAEERGLLRKVWLRC